MHINAQNLEERGVGVGARAAEGLANDSVDPDYRDKRLQVKKMKQTKIQTQHSLFSKNELVQICRRICNLKMKNK